MLYKKTPKSFFFNFFLPKKNYGNKKILLIYKKYLHDDLKMKNPKNREIKWQKFEKWTFLKCPKWKIWESLCQKNGSAFF